MPTSEIKISTSVERVGGGGRGEVSRGEVRGERGEGRGERGEGRGERGEGRGERGEGRGEGKFGSAVPCATRETFQVLHQPHQFLLFVREVRGNETPSRVSPSRLLGLTPKANKRGEVVYHLFPKRLPSSVR